MEKVIFNCYKKFQKETKENLFKAIFKLPKFPLILLIMDVVTTVVYFIGMVVFNNVSIVLVCLIIEVVICIILYFYTEHYDVKISRARLNEHIEYYSKVVTWLKNIGVNVTKENVLVIKEQFEKQIKRTEEQQKNKNDQIERWIQVLFIPIVLAAFTIMMERQTGIKEIIKQTILIAFCLVVVVFAILPLYQYWDFLKKRKIVQMRNLVDDLQGVLYTQTENKIITKTDESSNNNCKGRQRYKNKTLPIEKELLWQLKLFQ